MSRTSSRAGSGGKNRMKTIATERNKAKRAKKEARAKRDELAHALDKLK